MVHNAPSSSEERALSKRAPVMAHGEIAYRTPKANEADRLEVGLRQVAALLVGGQNWLLPIYQRLEAEYEKRDSLSSALERAQLILNDNSELVETKIISHAK